MLILVLDVLMVALLVLVINNALYALLDLSSMSFLLKKFKLVKLVFSHALNAKDIDNNVLPALVDLDWMDGIALLTTTLDFKLS